MELTVKRDAKDNDREILSPEFWGSGLDIQPSRTWMINSDDLRHIAHVKDFLTQKLQNRPNRQPPWQNCKSEKATPPPTHTHTKDSGYTPTHN